MFSHFWLELNTQLYNKTFIVLICKSNKCTFFYSIFNIIRETIQAVNNFLCKYSIKQFQFIMFVNSFLEIHEVNLQTLTERHVITLRKQLINLLYQPAWTILVKHGEINMTLLIILNKTQFYHRVKFQLYYLQVYDKCLYRPMKE